jgi:hypothetical protein
MNRLDLEKMIRPSFMIISISDLSGVFKDASETTGSCRCLRAAVSTQFWFGHRIKCSFGQRSQIHTTLRLFL